jgi:hypothetical protein
MHPPTRPPSHPPTQSLTLGSFLFVQPYNAHDDMLRATTMEVISTLKELLHLHPLYNEQMRNFIQVGGWRSLQAGYCGTLVGAWLAGCCAGPRRPLLRPFPQLAWQRKYTACTAPPTCLYCLPACTAVWR